MHTRFSISRINALFAVLVIIATTLFVSQAVTQNSTAQVQQVPQQQKQVVNKWEYQVLSLGPGSTDRFNEEVSEPQWEFVTSNKGWAIFRRPVKVIQ